MLPSDSGYVPHAADERIRKSPFYRQLLNLNIDPYAPHSINRDLIQLIESSTAAAATP